jgi:hypothetical protein
MKTKIYFTLTLLTALALIACDNDRQVTGNTTYIREGVGLGSIIAVVASWSRNQSILWAILHGIFSWFLCDILCAYEGQYPEILKNRNHSKPIN